MNAFTGYGLRSQTGRKKVMAKTQKETSSLEQNNEAWAERIRTAIDASGMTDLDIAKEVTERGISLSPRTIYNWKLNGGMSRDYITPFCEVVGCDKLWMLEGEEAARKEPLTLVRPKEDGRRQEHLRVPILEQDELLAAAEKIDGHEALSIAETHEAIMAYRNDPTKRPELFVPILRGHAAGAEVPGDNPVFACQIATDDHDDLSQQHGSGFHGALVAFSTSMWPARGDFCMFLRRMPVKKGEGIWTLHTGFFRSDARAVPTNAEEYWVRALKEKHDRGFTLKVKAFEKAVDDVYFNFSQCDMIFLGVGVCKFQWTSLGASMANTNLLDRKYNRLQTQRRTAFQSEPPD